MEKELHELNMMVTKVKAFAKALVESNKQRDAYMDREQDKFFIRLNRQQSKINGLKECLEQLELRMKALKLANELMPERLDNMATKLCFCSCTEGAQVRA